MSCARLEQCQPIANFLLNLGVNSSLWYGQQYTQTGCCGYDESTDIYTRQILCSEDTGEVEGVYWTGNQLFGDLSDRSLVGPTGSVIKEIDLSDNPGLGGVLPRWLTDMSSLETLSLANTNLSGQLPRLDQNWNALSSLDLSNTSLSGYVPALPFNIRDCELPANRVCYYPTANWTESSPPVCLKGLPTCQGSPPGDNPPPPLPPVLTPHLEDVTPPYTDVIKSITEQCKLLKQWLAFHGEDATKLWTDETTCCPYWRDNNAVPEREVSCLAWGPTYLNWSPSSRKLKGDINLPLNTLSELKGLRHVTLSNQSLTGGFPVWATQITDLFGLSLFNNSLKGPVLSMLQNEYFSTIDIRGNNFTGPLPQMAVLPSAYATEDSNYGICALGPGNNGLCWQYDTEFYDTTCVAANPQISSCSAGPQPPSPPPPPPTEFQCILSCRDKAHYFQARVLANGYVQCAGPNATACSWYTDALCTKVAPNEVPPIPDQGVVCGQIGAGWCALASAVLIDGETPATECPPFGPWTCVRSCADDADYVLVRSVGQLEDGGTVQCQGPDLTRCSWYSDQSCRILAADEPIADSSGEIGYYCDQLTSGWCMTAANAVFFGETNNTCAATGTQTTKTTTTTTAVLSSTGTSLAFFPTPPVKPPTIPPGSTFRQVPPASNVNFATDTGYLSCSSANGCTVSATSGAGQGTYVARCGSTSSGPCLIMDLLSQSNPGHCLAVDTKNKQVVEVKCSVTRGLVKRDSKYLPYWTLYSDPTSQGKDKGTKVLNANLGMLDGCMLLPGRQGTGKVHVGPCLGEQASGWTVTAGDKPTPTPTPPPVPPSGPNVGAIVGGVIGGLVGLALILGGGYFVYKRAKSKSAVGGQDSELQTLGKPGDPVPAPPSNGTTNGSATVPRAQTNGSVYSNGSAALVATAPSTATLFPEDVKEMPTYEATTAPSAPAMDGPSGSSPASIPGPSSPVLVSAATAGAASSSSSSGPTPALTAAAAAALNASFVSMFPQSTKPELAALIGKQGVAHTFYKRQHEDELTLTVGDRVVILTSHDGGVSRSLV